MARAYTLFAAALPLFVIAIACSDGDGDGGDGVPATSTATRGRTTPAGGATESAEGTTAQATGTAAAETTPAPGLTASAGREVADAEAAGILDAIVLKPADVTGTWSIGTDTTTDNAAAAAAQPDQAASIDRCGRLLGRTVVLMPGDQVVRYIGGQTVSFFTNVTVFKTAAGAADCAVEATTRFADTQELVKSFGTLFVRPAEVVVATKQYPPVGDGSFAATLSGKINAAGTEVDLTILVVGYLRGNVSVAVGSAAAFEPDVDELARLVDLTLQRVNAALQ